MSTEAEPREGLPPCLIGAVRLGERIAWWSRADGCKCPGSISPSSMRVAYGWHHLPVKDKQRGWPCKDWFIESPLLPLDTDDPSEAKAAFARGAEWVRTGELE